MQSSLKPEKTRNLFQFRPEMSTYQVLSPKNEQNSSHFIQEMSTKQVWSLKKNNEHSLNFGQQMIISQVWKKTMNIHWISVKKWNINQVKTKNNQSLNVSQDVTSQYETDSWLTKSCYAEKNESKWSKIILFRRTK